MAVGKDEVPTIRRSILRAADAVEEAPASAAAREPVRAAAAALEYHLDTLANELARAAIEPRLRRRAQDIEAQFREALLATWAIDRDLSERPVDEKRLHELATLIRRAGESEIDLVFEEIRDTAALD